MISYRIKRVFRSRQLIFPLFPLFPLLLPLIFAVAIPFLSACGTQKDKDTAFFAMDTVITLHLPADTDPTLPAACETLCRSLEATLSRTVPESDVSRFNASPTGCTVTEETQALVRLANQVARGSFGAFDITVAPLSLLWNVTGRADGDPPPRGEDIAECLAHVGYAHLASVGDLLKKDDPEVMIDLGAIAKGYACEKTVSLLQGAGVARGYVSFGGNIGVIGPKEDGGPFCIGLRHPDKAGDVAGYLHIGDGYISVSGDYERYFETDGIRYHHIIDPATGYPSENGIRSAVVWAMDGALADALSTALFVAGEAGLASLYGTEAFVFEAVLYTDDGKAIATPGLSDVYEHRANDYVLTSYNSEEN